MKKVIVIGGSSGGISTLCKILEGLPADFAAPVMAVIHTGQQSKFLANVLARSSRMNVVSPEMAEPITAGHVYVAAPNRHLIVRSHCVISWMGPRENRHRPAVDTLFRTAARAYRSNVIAVVLSGALDDGSAGAMAVKVRGGTVIVQDPAEAEYPDMPSNVLRSVKADYSLTAMEISSTLVKLASKGRALQFRQPTRSECERISTISFSELEPPGFTCPECGGMVIKIHNNKVAQFRCHVGHLFSLESFSEAHADALERALWVALRKLNERHSIQETIAKQSSGAIKKRHQENADTARRDMRLLHEILAQL